RSYMKKQLPDYMMPAAFVILENLPLTPNGKVDRKALPAPEQPGGSRESYVAPRTAVEELLCGLWSEVLKVERVGINENFFELGGRSLVATGLMTQIRDVCGVELGLRSLFESPTIAELAQKVEIARLGGQPSSAPPLAKVSHEQEPELSYAQQR